MGAIFNFIKPINRNDSINLYKMQQNTIETCRACGCFEITPTNKGILLGDVNVFYFRCNKCGYVQTERPFWLDRAYTSAINDTDTGIIERNCTNRRIVLGLLLLSGNLKSRVVDFAGGYGILVRMLRDRGVDALWMDEYCKNLVAIGFERTNETAHVVTAFEAFEHFVKPAEELDRMFAIAPNVLISTLLITDPAPNISDWWYYGTEHGQHIGFATLCTLQLIAKKRNKFFVSDGKSYHLFSDKPISKTMWLVIVFGGKLPAVIFTKLFKSNTWFDHLARKKINGASETL